MKGKKMQVIRVTKKEFEVEGGQVFQHPVELEYIPTIAEFQKYYDEWYKILSEKIDNAR